MIRSLEKNKNIRQTEIKTFCESGLRSMARMGYVINNPRQDDRQNSGYWTYIYIRNSGACHQITILQTTDKNAFH